MARPHLRLASEAPVLRSARPIIEMKGVSKTYRTRDGDVPSLKPIDFTITEGEFLVIVGPSGCGKSTLLKMVAGLLRPSTGEIRVEGRTIVKPHSDVGVVFQQPLLLPWRSVLANVMMPVEVKGLDKAHFGKRALDLLDMAGLADFAHKYPWQLSGGMQQRASICRALVHDPKIVLMDEPFGALDALTRDQLNVDLHHLWLRRRMTTVFVTHSISEAVFLSSRIVVFSPRPGRIVENVVLDLPAERRLAVKETPEFLSYTRHFRHPFETMGLIHD